MEKSKDEISIVDIYLNFRQIFSYLWTKKISIFVAGILGASVGFTYAVLKPIEYESKLTFIVDQAGGNKSLGALSGIASSFGLGGGMSDGGLYANQANLMNYLVSRSVIEESYMETIPGTRITFAEKFAREYKWKTKWSDDDLLSKIQFTPDKLRKQFTLQEDSVLFEIYKYTQEKKLINVSKPEAEGSILAIEFKSLDDTLSRYFPEILLSIVSANYIETKTKLARENVNLLQQQTDSVRSALYASLLSAATSTDQVFGLNPALNVKRVPATKEQIDIQASTVMLQELIKNLELAKVQLMDQKPLIEIIDRPQFPLEKLTTSKKAVSILSALFASVILSLTLIVHRFLKNLNKI
jgi:hypothetical protein